MTIAAWQNESNPVGQLEGGLCTLWLVQSEWTIMSYLFLFYTSLKQKFSLIY